MSKPGKDLAWEAHRTRWLRWLASELEKTEKNFPTETLPDNEYPDWVRNVEREFSAAMLPVAKIKDFNVVTPKNMGALLGHSCAMAIWLLEWVVEGSKKLEVEVKNCTNEPDLKAEKLPAKWRLDKWYRAMCRLAKNALRSSVDQTYEDMSEFLLGYSNAFARKPQTFKIGDFGNTTFEIYLFLLLYWKSVVQLKSVHDLHQVIVKILGAHRTGDLKRMEKICQRIGLRYRKPGRPKMRQTIQTPA
ncbi:MAG: hypothetical protein ABSD57_03070 [Verrucomicrobiota bacterium]|jgi:hypothetical protein